MGQIAREVIKIAEVNTNNMSPRVIAILSVFLLVFIVILFVTKYYQTQTPYNKVQLSGNNIIRNESQFSFIDTTLSVGLDVVNVGGTYILVRDLTSDIRASFSEHNPGVELQATIIGRGNQYILYVYKLDRVNAIQTIAHELIHLTQYHSGRLQIVSPTRIVWERDTLTTEQLYNIQYTQRPWEIEAFGAEGAIASNINKILYGKNM